MYLFDTPNEVNLARERLACLYESDPRPWYVAYSGGKYSTLLLQLVAEVSAQAGNRKTIYVSFSDTCLESGDKLKRIKRDFERIEANLGFNTVINRRSVDRSLWSLICGKGYPAPSHNLRFCTIELKEKPALKNEYELADRHGGLILITGVRKQESARRNKRLTANEAPDALAVQRVKRKIDAFAPIANVKTCELWQYLKSIHKFAWGGEIEELKELYDSEETSQRNGCWCCTVCSEKTFNDKDTTEAKDKVRRFLRRINNDPAKRCVLNTPRQVEKYKRGQAAGNFTLEARNEILDFILAVQHESGERLISDEEVEYIREYWQTKAPYEFS